MENYLFYSQLVLLILGFASFALAVLFRLRLKALKSAASDGLVPNVFNKSFVGDLKVLQLIKGFMPRISNYYLGLSVILIVLSIVFQSLVPYAMRLVSRYVDLVLQTSMAYGPVSYLMNVFLFSLFTVFIQILSSVIKGRIFKYSVELLHA